jgi:hypothetical protein
MIPPRLQSLADLQPLLEKLEAAPGSVVFIVLEGFKSRSDCRVSVAWLSREERESLRRDLLRCREKRQGAQDAAALPWARRTLPRYRDIDFGFKTSPRPNAAQSFRHWRPPTGGTKQNF